MKKSVKKVIQWVDDKLEVFIGAVFLALMVVFTTLQIVGRYLFSTPFPWTEEMTRYMFVWMVFISIGYAVKTGEHIRITFVRSLLRPGLRLYLDILCNILCFGFSVICMIEGYKLLSIIRRVPAHTNVAPLSCYAPGISAGVSKAGPVYGKDCGTDSPGGN